MCIRDSPASFHTLFTFQGIEKRPLLFIKGEYIAVPPSFIFSSYSITGTTPGYLTAMFGYPAWKLPSVSSYLKLPRSPWAVLSVREGYILLFFNAFSYKLFNMISSKVRFVKEFREFSESLKEFSYIHPILLSTNSHPVKVNALNMVVSMTILDVNTPSCPIFFAIT